MEDTKNLIRYELISEQKDQKSIMLYGIDPAAPDSGVMLTVTEEKDPDGTIWITTSGLEKSVSVKLGNPPVGLLKNTDLEDHKEIVTDISINKWIEEGNN